jgi:hypothetical protein
MLALIAFCVLFIACAIAASGTAKLIMFLISPGELLERWQQILSRIYPANGDRYYALRIFWYKRLGGCAICLRQVIAELSFIVFCLLYCNYGAFPTEAIDTMLLRWLLNIIVFIGYCGTTLQIGEWLDHRPGNTTASEENIIETRYRNN